MEIEVKCERCDRTLKTSTCDRHTEFLTIEVDRCECADEEIREEAFGEGFVEGNREGYDDGKEYGYDLGMEEGKKQSSSIINLIERRVSDVQL